LHTCQDFKYHSDVAGHLIKIVKKKSGINSTKGFGEEDKNEWVSDCCLMPTLQFFQLFYGENKLIFNEMMMRSAVY
jgi:hypothetical protein